MQKSSYELDLSNARDEAKDQIRRLCERVATWADGMTRGCPREFEVNWIFRAPPGTTPLGPHIAKLAERLIRSDYNIEGLAVLVCRRPWESRGILGATGDVAHPESRLFKMSAAGRCNAWLQARYARLADKFFREWLKFGNKSVE